MLRNLDKGIPVCVTVTLLEGLVLARSIFNHSMNYRSVVVLGTAVSVNHVKEKLVALMSISEHILPGRWSESRLPNERELKQTLVMCLPIKEYPVYRTVVRTIPDAQWKVARELRLRQTEALQRAGLMPANTPGSA